MLTKYKLCCNILFKEITRRNKGERLKMTVYEAFERFIKKCEVKNLSEKTIKDYRNKNKGFIKFVGAENDVKIINSETIDNYILFLKNKESINDTSVVTFVRNARTFCNFLMDSGMIDYFKISLPKAEKKIKQTYSDEDLEKLLVAPDDKAKKKEKRAYAFVSFLIGTGARLSTAVNVKVADIDFEDGYIFFDKTKNRIEYQIPLSAALSEVLKKYIEDSDLKEEDYLFSNSYGKKASERTYEQLVQWFNNFRGVECTSCHAFRHTFAKKYVMNGGDCFRLQRLLAHADIKTTQVYVDLFNSDLKKDFDLLTQIK